MKKKKLLIFHPYLAPYRVDFFNKLNINFELKIYFKYSNDPVQQFDLKSLRENINFSYEYITRGFKILNRDVRFGFWNIIFKESPEILITHEFSSFSLRAMILKLLRKDKIRWYITSDDSLEIVKKLSFHRRISRILILPILDGLIVVNEEVKKWHELKYSNINMNIFVMPIIQHEDNFRMKLENSIPISLKYINKYKLENKKIALFVGRLVEVKAIDRLVRIFSTINDQDARLIVVGEGPLKKRIKEIIVENNDNRILVVGRYDGLDLIAWYNLASFFVLPSLFEPFGAVINEALISGVYVLCSEIAGSSSLIEEGKNGTLINPYKESDIRKSIVETLKTTYCINKVNVFKRKSLMSFDFNLKMNELDVYLNK